ncbi:bifunctional protein-serine/threonine kinase/phosphatase [Alteromonas pelagimontana]|uniref:Bifunctional protein-serine/threonine kinase/phosphatase n=1 Tax=Alteromonas pelagimontana TaxID=1858656 RepID=A0A6M4MBE3_9ALTE|nr:bifunctional protein-serine/threonine kinase/phosphatase [Alteromonas pelagimontana]QJR80347.1 bifunctional protein-serine/threonine kinase/phosphatase [Alteromonas pelagimontana]
MLSLSIGQYSSAGDKPVNQDAYGAVIPEESILRTKGAAVAIADGIGSSTVSEIASRSAIKRFLEDYFCTSDASSVEQAAGQVVTAINAVLCAQTRNSPFMGEPEKGFVCTFSSVIFKRDRAYLFHAGDSRMYRLREGKLEQLTRDHRTRSSGQQDVLSNALGIHEDFQLDVQEVKTATNDCFILATDGVYDFLPEPALCDYVMKHIDRLDFAAQSIVEQAFANGSDDNLTVQLIRINAVPADNPKLSSEAENLPVPPVLSPNEKLDNYLIQRHLYASARSHIYLATDIKTRQQLIIKAPSVALADNPGHLEKFMIEEWAARRVRSQHLLSVPETRYSRSYLYTVSNFIEGQTLKQWATDNPAATVENVRILIEQVARGLMALHRDDVLHQDVRPENIMIDNAGTVKIIDFGAASIVGIQKVSGGEESEIPGTAIYAAPEYFLGESGTPQSDQFSLAVLTYFLLCGTYPYGSDVAKCRSVTAQHKLKYRSVLHPNREIPFWVDCTLKKALQPNPHKRYRELSEFIYDLRHPNPKFMNRHRPPLAQRHPIRFWQSVSAGLLMTVLVLLIDKFT